MNKILLGVLLGAVLGIFDGLTAWLTPAVRPYIIGIVIGSTFKGVIAGIAAGWFARKVQSVPAGIAFGLVVGLLLAYAVAAMPSETGEHYYFEIMLPGSIVGAILGWATQRYGKPAATRSAVATATMLFVAIAITGSHASAAVTAKEAFAQLKTLAGKWEPHVIKADGPQAPVEFKILGGDATIIETLFGGTPHEMVTAYTIEGDDLLLRHYCSEGNQPLLRLDREKSTSKELFFTFVNVAGDHADHMHDGWIKFKENGWEASWNFKTSGPKKFFAQRAQASR